MSHILTMRDTTQDNLWKGSRPIDSLRQFDIDRELYFLVSNKDKSAEASFFAFMLGNSPVKQQMAASPEFFWTEFRQAWLTMTSDTVSAGTAATVVGEQETDWAFTSGAGATNGDIWAVFDADDTSKFFLVYLVSGAGSTMTVRMLTKPNFVVAASDPVYRTSLAFAEGADMATSTHVTPVKKWGSTHIFKGSVTLSKTVLRDKTIIYGDELNFQLNEKKMEVLRAIDNALLFGSGRYSAVADDCWGAPPATYLADASGDPVRTTCSLEQAITMAYAVNGGDDRVISIDGNSATYIDDIVTNFETVFKYGNREKKAFCGNKFITFANRLALASPTNFQVQNGADSFGIKIKRLVTPHGELDLTVNNGLLQHETLSKSCYIVDPEFVSVKEFEPLNIVQLATTKHAEIWEVRADIGLKVVKPETCSILRVK